MDVSNRNAFITRSNFFNNLLPIMYGPILTMKLSVRQVEIVRMLNAPNEVPRFYFSLAASAVRLDGHIMAAPFWRLRNYQAADLFPITEL